MHSDLEPHGCLGDLGWYTIRFILWVMQYATPRAVTGRLLNSSGRSDSPCPVPTEFTGQLFFEDVSASFYCSFLTEHQQLAHVSGSKGNLRIDDFVLPFFGNRLQFQSSNAVFDCDICDFRMERESRPIKWRSMRAVILVPRKLTCSGTFPSSCLKAHLILIGLRLPCLRRRS